MQTPREVVDALLRKKKSERMALVEGPWSDTIANWVREGYPTRTRFKRKGQKRWRADDGMWEDAEQDGDYIEPVPVWEHFGFDMVGTAGWFNIQPLRGFEEMVEETAEWEVKRNGAGAALKYWKHKSGTPEHIDFLMNSREIWDRDYREHVAIWDPGRMEDIDEQIQNTAEARQAQRWVHYGHMFIWEIARQSLGDVNLYENLLLDPGWIRDFNQVYTDLYKKAFTYLFEHIGLPDGVWLYEDLGYKNGPFASPRVFSQLIFPYYKAMVDFFHARDLPVVLHSCGSVAAVVPLIIEAGFDALNPMERKAKDNDPFVFAEKYGDKLAFVGGLDARVFETNDKAVVKREMEAYLKGMKDRGARLVFASDHSLSTNVRYDTYRYAVDVFHENMLY